MEELILNLSAACVRPAHSTFAGRVDMVPVVASAVHVAHVLAQPLDGGRLPLHTAVQVWH
jgi:hypothetical protein